MKINIGIIGGAGYTGGELLRILLNHPQVNINFVNSKSQAGKPVYSTHSDLVGDTDLLFTDQMPLFRTQRIKNFFGRKYDSRKPQNH